MNFFLLLLLSLLINTVFQIPKALAFRFTPMVAEVSPQGEGTSQVFVVENNSKEKVALQFKATTRSYEVDGKETRSITTDFVIYPEQIALEPNDKRNVRVTYVGAPNIQIEKPYRLIATQLPVEFKKSQKISKLNFLLEYVAALYVNPTNTSPQIKVLSTKTSGDHTVLLEVENQGTQHQLLTDAKLSLILKTQTLDLNKKSFEEFRNENLLPKEKRILKVETTQALQAGQEIISQLTFPDPRE
ncbi:MAG TPA: fimbria/pilus periplasmic chaperone [Pseudobdellovibrionaceae bacterium]|nr:fimbria/pilus periplasmic chaperone [Pseudobdellovibrionaceae bacterium]